MKTRLYKVITFIIGICFFAQIDVVLADTNIGGGGGNEYLKPCSKNRPTFCYNALLGTGTGDVRVQGVRVSIVDEQGNRVSGTNSVDYVQNEGHVTQINSSRVLKSFAPYKYTKNEIVAGQYANPHVGRAYNVTLLGDLPTFINIGPNTKIEEFLEAKAKQKTPDGKLQSEILFLEACGLYKKNYTSKELEKFSVLLEPLTFMRVTYFPVTGSPTYENYFGTVTEITRMLVDDGVTLWTGYFGKLLPLSIYVRDYYDKDGVLRTERAGLKSISAWVDANKSDYSAEILTYNGTAAGHFWVPDLVEPDVCETNPNKLPDCCHLPQNKNKLPQCCGLDENKNKQECNPDLCTFKLDINMPEDCDESTTGYVKDTDDWSCIFASRNSNDPNVRDHFYKWGNRYCSIYCREDVSYRFPSDNTTVLSGSHFTVGDTWYSPNFGPVHYTGVSECRTTSDTGDIRYDLFEDDWQDANDYAKERWDIWQIAIKRDWAARNYASRSRESRCGCVYNTSRFSCCTEQDREWHDKTCTRTRCTGSGEDRECESYERDCSHWDYFCAERDYTKHYRYYPATVYYDGDNVTPGSYCEGDRPNFYISSKRSAYYSAVNAREKLEENLRDCNDWERKYDEFSPTIGLQYDEPFYGGNYYNLSKDYQISRRTLYYVNGNDSPSVNRYKETDYMYEYICNRTGYTCKKGSYVSGSKMTYPVNDWLEQITTKEYDYTLPSGVYKYVLKPSGDSVDNSPGSEENYIDIGYGNLPVHYSTRTDEYDIFLQTTSFGTNHNFNKYVFNGYQMGINYGDSVGVYTWLFDTGITYMISDCHAGGHHLNHGFGAYLLRANKLREFQSSSCYDQYNCQQVTSGYPYKIKCYKDREYNKNYVNLMRCISSKVSSLSSSISRNYDTRYECEYNVVNTLMDNPSDPSYAPEGIDVVYRTISLDNPFPGKAGKGRNPGNNWSSSEVNEYILHNRNLQDPDRIYFDREPMYEINLTPVLIKQIRSYNRKQATNNHGGYADFELDCDEGTGRECKSDFIRSEFKQYFVSSRCGMSNNWNACAYSDNRR